VREGARGQTSNGSVGGGAGAGLSGDQRGRGIKQRGYWQW
jgi:hypothetical protein